MDNNHQQIEQATRRLFFALWPSDDVRAAMVKVFKQSSQAKLRAKTVMPGNLHITLHFIGNVDTERQACLHQAATSVRSEPFNLRLDRYGHFYQARVFWLGCSDIPPVLKQLYTDLATAFTGCGYTADKRPYAPHVTLMRKLLKPGPLIQPEAIHWPVREFVMLESLSHPEGVEYRVIERYPLG
ncbi:MAG: RNA 2',3'-cyclic phosphodiesterase [Gammaproteobacteria bacterium]|nr:MAG: RNA 2',3'-cyclic phosphodiesterase [Gammaproteobacteria bacterium]